MEIKKELSDISLPITEEEYRARPELSYSTLSTYEKTQYDGLEHLFDKKETPSLTFGSAVDAIITGGADEFNSRFMVLDITITEGGMNVAKKLAEMNLPYVDFYSIPESTVSYAAKEVGFWKDPKWDKRRYQEVLKTGNIDLYYAALLNSDKTILDTATYNDVIACVRALRESPSTCHYFADNDEMSSIRRYYQLKFRSDADGVGYRCMMDLVVVDYEAKKIYPIDLKTSSKKEWHFEDSFLTWNYMIQARLYWRILRDNLLKDDYFKDFILEDYRFIVINRETLTPLVWEFPLTKMQGTLVDEKGNEYRDPYIIGKELRGYLDLKPEVPNGINKDGINIINCLKLKP
jgi:hypothetical protein